MTRINSYDIYKCPDCKCEHILPNYASISLTPAVDADIPDADLRVCSGCGVVKPFKDFLYVGTKQKPSLDYTPNYVKFIKRLFGIKQPEPRPNPANLYPYLNSKTVKAASTNP